MQNSQSKFCKDCTGFYEGYNMDFCRSPKNSISEITGQPKVGIVHFTRGMYCKGDWFEPKSVVDEQSPNGGCELDKQEKVKHNSFFQRIKKVWFAWKESKYQ